MRTRFLSQCTHDEVEAYLERSDVLFVAAGVTEMHGGLPLDAESVLSEAFALELAERVDGLVLHNLPYLYAGATASGRGTTQIGVRASIDYLVAIAESLIRQGFRRIIWTSLHGPASIFVGPVVREIFEMYKVSMLYIDPLEVISKNIPGGAAALMGTDGTDPFGDLAVYAYDRLGRLGDVPLTTEASAYWSQRQPSSAGFAEDLLAQAFGSSSVGYYFAEPTDHMFTQALRTPQERAAAAQRGAAGFSALVGSVPIEKLVADLARLAEYNQAVLDRYPSTRAL